MRNLHTSITGLWKPCALHIQDLNPPRLKHPEKVCGGCVSCVFMCVGGDVGCLSVGMWRSNSMVWLSEKQRGASG